MNIHVLGALFRDALYQVLDNKVFRLLVILVAFMVLPTFLVAAREDALVILFGWREFLYVDIFGAFNMPYPGRQGANVMLIQTVQKLLVDSLAGTFGIVFAISATAFFLPRMVEKGAADTVFSKPVSRIALMLSRYLAGLIFVSILAVVLVGGMHIGLLVNSGYSDPGFLWSIVTLIYLFALLHAFSIAVGVFTRSTVAAILLSLMFFAFAGCVHNGWQVRQFFLEVVQPELISDGTPSGPEGETMQAVAGGLIGALNVLHYTLPKTTDAPVIAEKLRLQVEESDGGFKDEDTGLEALVELEGFDWIEPDEDTPEGTLAVWSAPHPRGLEDARVLIRKHEDTSRRAAVQELEDRLTSEGIEWDEDRVPLGEFSARLRTWTREVDGATWRYKRFFILTGHVFVIELSGDDAWLTEHEQPIKVFLASLTRDDEDDHNPFAHYRNNARWGGPLKYNLWFSVLSSVMFMVVILGIGWWRLSRIDF